ncbi:MAG: hypothetical protein ACYC8T_10720 [Myxococcaceae bacterium]
MSEVELAKQFIELTLRALRGERPPELPGLCEAVVMRIAQAPRTLELRTALLDGLDWPEGELLAVAAACMRAGAYQLAMRLGDIEQVRFPCCTAIAAVELGCAWAGFCERPEAVAQIIRRELSPVVADPCAVTHTALRAWRLLAPLESGKRLARLRQRTLEVHPELRAELQTPEENRRGESLPTTVNAVGSCGPAARTAPKRRWARLRSA